jgi:hypothetical protein
MYAAIRICSDAIANRSMDTFHLLVKEPQFDYLVELGFGCKPTSSLQNQTGVTL